MNWVVLNNKKIYYLSTHFDYDIHLFCISLIVNITRYSNLKSIKKRPMLPSD